MAIPWPLASRLPRRITQIQQSSRHAHFQGKTREVWLCGLPATAAAIIHFQTCRQGILKLLFSAGISWGALGDTITMLLGRKPGDHGSSAVTQQWVPLHGSWAPVLRPSSMATRPWKARSVASLQNDFPPLVAIPGVVLISRSYGCSSQVTRGGAAWRPRKASRKAGPAGERPVGKRRGATGAQLLGNTLGNPWGGARGVTTIIKHHS